MTPESYSPGLEGVIATDTQISFLDVDHERIVVRGYDLIELARRVHYADVAFLLIHGALPGPGKQAMFANDYQTARRRYQEAVSWDPDPKYWFNLAVANVQLGLLDEGNIAARRALQSASSEGLKHKAQKLLDIIAREDAKARGAAASATSAASAESEAAKLANAAEAEAAAGRYDNALAQFRRAYEVVPQAEVLFNIGKMEHRLGRCAEAVRTLQRIEPTWPHDPAVPRAGQLLRQIGRCPP